MAVVEGEARRQVDLIEDGGKVVQETRLYDPDRNETRSMRSKEDAHDYRYFPDPDLLPLELDDAFLDECRASLPELPDAKRHRYEAALGLSPYNADVLTAEVETARWFEALLRPRPPAAGQAGGRSRQAGGQLADFRAVRRAQQAGRSLENLPVSPRPAPSCWRWWRRDDLGLDRQAGAREDARERRRRRRHRRARRA